MTTLTLEGQRLEGQALSKTALSELDKIAPNDDALNKDDMNDDALSDDLQGLTMERLVDHCLRMRPDEAARRGDSTLCVTPLIQRLLVDGQIYDLALVNGRWGALNVRVSSEIQRSALSQQNKEKQNKEKPAKNQPEDMLEKRFEKPKKNRGRAAKQDGYSEEEQIVRGIRHFVRAGQAFKIYSDAGVTGEYPNNDPALITRLLGKKAARYERIFRATLLDETSRTWWTTEQIAKLEGYLAATVASIRNGQVSQDYLLTGKVSPGGSPADMADTGLGDTGLGGPELSIIEVVGTEGSKIEPPRRRRGRPSSKVFFRQGFTQLWQDTGTSLVHTTAISDRSRLCRDADLETAMLERMAVHGTRIVGLMEDLSSLDVSDPLRKGLTYLIASINEQRLSDIAQASFRGTMQRLRSGRPGGRPPWWLWRDEDGETLVREELRPLVARIVEMSLSGTGARAITTRLHGEGVRVDGKSLTLMQVQYMITHDVLAGRQNFCGLSWDVYPRLIDDETLEDLRRGRKGRAEKTASLNNERTWARHTFTGIMRCSCGARMCCSAPTKARKAAGETGYYRCECSNKDKNQEGVHAWISDQRLEAFFGELLGCQPDLLLRVLSSGDGRALAASARRQHLEERLSAARTEYAGKEASARVQAAASAASLGLTPGTAGYETVLSGLCQSLLVGAGEAVEALTLEMACAGAEAGHHRQVARALEAARELSGWAALDTETRNRLLRVLVDKVVVYSMGRMRPGRGRGGYLEIWLAGVDVPLPPVRMKRGAGKTVLLPTPGEWIADMFSENVVSGNIVSEDVISEDVVSA
jgi:DNA invertase Pin-like site-specific DNA recombinase